MPPREGRKRLDRAVRAALGAKADRIKTFPGLLGAYVNGVPTVRVNNRLDFVWVRLRGGTSEIIQAFNDKVGIHWDLPILVYRDPDAPDMWRVYGRDIAQYEDWQGASYLPPHADSHSFAGAPRTGADVVWAFKRQFMPMLPRPIATGSMAIFVESDFWFYGGAYHWWPGSGIAISNAHRPTGAITARFVTVYMDGPSESLMLLDGPEFPAWTPPTDPGDFIALPAPPTGIPIAAAFITTGTTFIGWGEIYDLRLPVAAQLGTGVVGGGGGGGSGSIVLDDEGSLLGSASRLDFVGPGVSASLVGDVGTIAVPGPGVDQIGFFATDDGIPLGSGTILESGYGIDASLSGTVLEIRVETPLTGTVVIRAEGITQGSAPILDFVGAGVDASISGSVATITIPGGGGGGGGAGIMFWDDGVPKATGTVLDARYGLLVEVSGAVARLDVETPVTGTAVIRDEGITQGSAPIFDFVGAGVDAAVAGGVATITIPGGGGGGGGAGLMFWDDGVPKATGTVLDAGYGLRVDVSGVVARLDVEPPITGTVVLLDEGLILGSAGELDFVGAGVTVSISGLRGQIVIPAGGGAGGGLVGVMNWDDGVEIGTGTIIDWGGGLTATLSGTVLHVDAAASLLLSKEGFVTGTASRLDLVDINVSLSGSVGRVAKYEEPWGILTAGSGNNRWYYGLPGSYNATTHAGFTAGQAYSYPFYVGSKRSVDSLAVHVGFGGATGTFARVAIYSDLQDQRPYPYRPVSPFVTLITSSNAVFSAPIAATWLYPGRLYWLVLYTSAGGTQYKRAAGNQYGANLMGQPGSLGGADPGWAWQVTMTGVTAANGLNDPFPAGASLLSVTQLAPLVFLRYNQIIREPNVLP